MNVQSLLACANSELTRWKENTSESPQVSATSAEMAAGSWNIPAAPHTVRSGASRRAGCRDMELPRGRSLIRARLAVVSFLFHQLSCPASAHVCLALRTTCITAGDLTRV